jgi:excisionase family DNA binding protein
VVDDTQDSIDDRWLTTEAAAIYLSCGPSRVRYLVKTGRLRSARDVRRLIFKKSWLDQAIDQATERNP